MARTGFNGAPTSLPGIAASPGPLVDGVLTWASTGPRHHCRGSRLLRAADRGFRLPGFNGAPTSLPGIVEPRVRCARWPQRRFNGAPTSLPGIGDRRHVTRSRSASTGPRHHCRGSLPSPTGRSVSLDACFNGAPTSLPGIGRPRRIPRPDMASTGPRHHCRGSPSADAESGSTHCLGRFNGAPTSLPGIGSCRTSRASRCECPCFNGAPTSLPGIGSRWVRPLVFAVRRFNGAPTSLPGIGLAMAFNFGNWNWLQRGPDITAGDRSGAPRPTSESAHTVDRASTGPRHHCRGSVNPAMRDSLSALALQRGPDITAGDRGRWELL